MAERGLCINKLSSISHLVYEEALIDKFEIDSEELIYVNDDRDIEQIVEIDTLIQLLEDLKYSNCTHVSVSYDEDHEEYILSGFQVREATESEVADVLRSNQLRSENARKIKELQSKIEALRSEMDQLITTSNNEDFHNLPF